MNQVAACRERRFTASTTPSATTSSGMPVLVAFSGLGLAMVRRRRRAAR